MSPCSVCEGAGRLSSAEVLGAEAKGVHANFCTAVGHLALCQRPFHEVDVTLQAHW